MMKLSLKTLSDSFWQDKGYQLPQYDIAAVRQNTMDEPQWLHFGAGNIFRAFLANAQQQLLNEHLVETGIIAASVHNIEAFEKAYYPYDNLCIFARLKNDRSMDKIVIGSITEALCMNTVHPSDVARLKVIFANPSLQMVSFTVTEKGYQLKTAENNYLPEVQNDIKHGIDNPQSFVGKLTAMLHHRFQNGAQALALVSMDNMSHNGEILRNAIFELATLWQSSQQVSKDFLAWLHSDKIAFPWTMIDKITPRPDKSVADALQTDGLIDITPVVTSRNTYIAPFVNAEELEYLVIEDVFPNGRPPLEKAGILFTNRETVNKVETMKVTTCLNPIHTGLAIFGCLLGYSNIHAEMQDEDLLKLAQTIGYREGLPVVIDPKILTPKQFIDEVLNVRLPNPFIPDTPQRIATDTSQKLAIRFGETIKAYQENTDLNAMDLVAIPLVFAGWCRYLLGIDDNCQSFTCSPDPRLQEVQKKLHGVQLGSDNLGNIQALLSDDTLFGINLYTAGLGEKTEQFFLEMLSGSGAIRATLQKYL